MMYNGNIVNLLGGPACGKSTMAARLYSAFKQMHVDVEYVNEYAKELVYEEHMFGLKDQLLVVAVQHHKIWAAARNNNMVITDSPILLANIYDPTNSDTFRALIIELHKKYNNINILLKRTDHFHTMAGRIHSLTQSISIDNRIKQMMDEEGMDYLEFDPTKDSIDNLIKLIKQEFAL